MTDALPQTMRAVKIVEAGKAEVQTVPLPRLRDDYILVKTEAVALNPTDWKHIDFLSSPGATVGCDVAGTVVAVGPKVTKKFKAGDQVVAVAHGSNAVEHEDGSFGEFAVIKGDLAIPLPRGLSVQEGATLGVGVTTVGFALFQKLGVPLPGQGGNGGAFQGKWLLVYGGSTATGTLVVQYAKLAGLRVITVNSAHNNALVASLGAEKSFDYNDPDAAEQIRRYTNDELELVVDCVSKGDSSKFSSDAIGPKGGKVSILTSVAETRDDVEYPYTLSYTVLGEPFTLRGKNWPARPEDFEYGKKFWDLSYTLLSEGKIKPHPYDVRDGGLDGILHGLDDLRHGKVSGKKLVYNIAA